MNFINTGFDMNIYTQISSLSALVNAVIGFIAMLISLCLAIFAFKTLINGQKSMARQGIKDYKEEKRRNEYEEKKQASNINLWLEDVDKGSSESQNGKVKMLAVLQNNSNQCAYNLCFMFRNRDEVVKPISKTKYNDFGEAFKGIIGEPEKIMYLPPKKKIKIKLSEKILYLPEVLFTDSNNIEWFRDFRGNLIKYNYMKLDYFRLFSGFKFYLPNKILKYKNKKEDK